MKTLLRLSTEVAEALHAHRPVVAFESTIISHGMPYPRNVETALAAEAIAREAGVVPATIALLDGRIAVGLERRELERLATEKDVLKVSRRDLAWALASNRTGATTVSATMLAARQAGIDVFATGGIGGVHRGAGETFDISADLTELAATSVCVVSAGAKAVLDLPKTLEVLETLGVPGARLRHLGAAGVLYALQRPAALPARGHPGRGCRRSAGATFPRLPSGHPRCEPRACRVGDSPRKAGYVDRGGGVGPGRPRDQRQGRHPLPSLAHPGALRRCVTGNECQALPQQRPRGLLDRRGVRAARVSAATLSRLVPSQPVCASIHERAKAITASFSVSL